MVCVEGCKMPWTPGNRVECLIFTLPFFGIVYLSNLQLLDSREFYSFGRNSGFCFQEPQGMHLSSVGGKRCYTYLQRILEGFLDCVVG